MNDKVIAQMFSDYVNRMADQERHTEAACVEVDNFDVFLTGAFPDNSKLQNALYERMLNVAVEFEESGFIAGFKTAMQIFLVNVKGVA